MHYSILMHTYVPTMFNEAYYHKSESGTEHVTGGSTVGIAVPRCE